MSRFFLLAVLLSLLFGACPSLSATVDAEPSTPLDNAASPSQPAGMAFLRSKHTVLRTPRHLLAATPAPLYTNATSTSTPSAHHFGTFQAQDVFIMRELTHTAPWSPRIQPALLMQYKPITYTQWNTGLTVSTGTPWLILFEGSLSFLENERLQNENDVWASVDDGKTWDLIAGVSRYGGTWPEGNNYHPSASPNTSFSARGGANNCEDPASDYVFSIGGYVGNGQTSSIIATNQVWYSTDGKRWQQQDPAFSFVPNRFFSSCDLDASGHIFSMGGVNQDQNEPGGRLLNDVWSSSIVTGLRQWRRITNRAAWSARAEHLVLVGEAPVLQKEIIYVIGGMVQWEEGGGYTQQSNDVWASSDGGYQWLRLTAAAPFGRRWGHGGVFTEEGVLLVFGGSNSDSGFYEDTYSYRDIWTSFDGGRTWSSCNVPDGPDSNRAWIRTEQGIAINERGEMIIASGYSYDGAGQRYDYRDVWKTDFSLSNTNYLGQVCNAVVPPAGIGLRDWRGGGTPSPVSYFTMTAQTRRAPWSARSFPGLLVMSKPITYKQAGTGVTVSTTPNWLLLYEGALSSQEGAFSAENDVWASADLGKTWDLIAGVSINGAKGRQEAAGGHADTSFQHRALSNNCEDPSNDDVYSVGGVYGTGLVDGATTNEVWFSSDAVTWTRRSGRLDSFTPTRFQASCDVDTNHVLYVVGGFNINANGNTLLNDVWSATNQGRNWKLVTARAPWKPRALHVAVIHNNVPLGRAVLYVAGGLTSSEQGSITQENDVWASSDGGATWAVITGNAPWNRRWGTAGVVTDNGVMLVIGGTTTSDGFTESYQSLRDMWLSLDGGSTWSQCNLPTDHGYVRGQQGAALTADGRLVLASGYAFQINAPRTDYTDLWISNITVTNAQRMSDACGGYALPSAGLGLRFWPGTQTAPTDPTLSAIAWAGIVTVLIVLFAVTFFCYWSYKRTGRLPLPGFMQPAQRHPRQPAQHGDYFVPGTGGSLDGGFGNTGGGLIGKGDVYSNSDSFGGDNDYRPPTGGYVPPGASGDHSHGLLS